MYRMQKAIAEMDKQLNDIKILLIKPKWFSANFLTSRKILNLRKELVAGFYSEVGTRLMSINRTANNAAFETAVQAVINCKNFHESSDDPIIVEAQNKYNKAVMQFAIACQDYIARHEITVNG